MDRNLCRVFLAPKVRFLFFAVFLLFSGKIVLEAIERAMIFFPERLPRGFSFVTLARWRGEELFLTARDRVVIHALYYPSPQGERFAFLYLHGNAGSLADWQFVAEDLLRFGPALLILDYRGYGKSGGEITEEGLYRDAYAGWEALLGKGFSPEGIIIYGRSLGTAVGIALAKEVSPRALILESPFTSLRELARDHYPFLPPGLPRYFTFDNGRLAGQLQLPVLILHGDQDEIVPVEHARRLYGLLPGPKKLVVIPGGHHNDLGTSHLYYEAIQVFLEEILGAQGKEHGEKSSP
jgi:fermentation-respiration switch protein FrsA (DUF1100 family)